MVLGKAVSKLETEGPGKRGHIVEGTLLPMMFLGLCKLNWETFVAGTKCF